jgi:predicted MPP superfamily phosphohydrolase
MRPFNFFIQRRSLAVLRTRRVNLRARGSSLGVRIVLASDIHARDDWFGRDLVAAFVHAVNDVPDVDLIALTGDFVGDNVSAIDWAAVELGKLHAPTVSVLGNHDHWEGAARITGALEQAGIEVLTNRARAWSPERSDLWLAGIDSAWPRSKSDGPGANTDAAFADVPAGAEAVVLGHEPSLASLHAQSLHLAGHTHCGQVRSPLFGDWSARFHMPHFSDPYPCWLTEIDAIDTIFAGGRRTPRDRRWVYTTAGVGYSTADVRFLCPSEIVVIDA